MSSYSIAVLPGDGIGPEITDAAEIVLKRLVASNQGLALDLTRYEAGASHYRATGVTLPPDVVTACVAADAVLLAAIGLPDVRNPNGTEVQPEMMVGLRRALDVQSAPRPVKLYPGVRSPLADVGAGIDMVIVRENLEGLFASFGGGAVVGDQVATDTIVITRAGTEKACRYAFELARRRNGRPRDGRRRVTCVDKANVFRCFAFFREVFFDVAKQYPDIEADALYVDAVSLYLVQEPDAYDVLVMENQFGDILSDLGAGLVGGLGMAPSAEIGDHHALFQPSHGSAPTIAGQNIANPIAMILSAAMMLDWLGERHDDPLALGASKQIEAAVAGVLARGDCRTRDLGGAASTTDFAEAVAAAL
ncbi:3-isopropylmalate dehydrogenase [Pirellulimonas nuda]|uniref:3-isopropylmalate dehydrogenase n=1 Tax=Pirellulimonas nuda TaxID=2528009 RepID=A0A518DI82_9BACT|nr:isocitrate/isopropylmalate dehydrogenase family protein [Pirellulimonas nuda]QDU91190.1 3-isopropylmalate dehydrogenase [Pirellulimonas nuda]